MLTRPAVFLDRDGDLNLDKGYVHTIADFEWVPGAREAIRLCNDEGYFVFVVTNQSGVARGLYDESAVLALHNFMNEELAQMGGHIDAFEYCPHHPEAAVPAYRKSCERRKPGPGMILDLLKNWPVDRQRSFLVGNEPSDLAAAAAAGAGWGVAPPYGPSSSPPTWPPFGTGQMNANTNTYVSTNVNASRLCYCSKH